MKKLIVLTILLGLWACDGTGSNDASNGGDDAVKTGVLITGIFNETIDDDSYCHFNVFDKSLPGHSVPLENLTISLNSDPVPFYQNNERYQADSLTRPSPSASINLSVNGNITLVNGESINFDFNQSVSREYFDVVTIDDDSEVWDASRRYHYISFSNFISPDTKIPSIAKCEINASANNFSG